MIYLPLGRQETYQKSKPANPSQGEPVCFLRGADICSIHLGKLFKLACKWVVSRVMRKIDYSSGRNLLQWAVLKNVLYFGHRESLGSGGLVGNVTAFIAVREQVIGWRYIIPFLWVYCVVQMEQVIDRMAYISGVHAIII